MNRKIFLVANMPIFLRH